MAEEKIDVSLLNNANEYVEVFKISRALKTILADKAKFGLADSSLLTASKFVEIVMENYQVLGYSAKPTMDSLKQAMASARNLTLRKTGESLKAVKDISENEDILVKSYAAFKQGQEEKLAADAENLKDLKAELKEQRKLNAKQKRKLGWGIFGKIVTAAVAAVVGASYVTSVFSLAGGFVGMASISTMPFLLLGAAGGAILYAAGKRAVRAIWGALTASIDAARKVLGGDENVKGSNRALSKAKKLAKQNMKALNYMKANINSRAPENANALVELENLLGKRAVNNELQDAIVIGKDKGEQIVKQETEQVDAITLDPKKEKTSETTVAPAVTTVTEKQLKDQLNSDTKVVLEHEGDAKVNKKITEVHAAPIIEEVPEELIYADVHAAQQKVRSDKKDELENGLVDIIYENLGLTNPYVLLAEANKGKETLVDAKSGIPMSAEVNAPVLTEEQVEQKRAIEKAARNVVQMFGRDRAPTEKEVKEALQSCSKDVTGKELNVDAVFNKYKAHASSVKENEAGWETVFADQEALKDPLEDVVEDQAYLIEEVYPAMVEKAAKDCIASRQDLSKEQKAVVVEQVSEYYTTSHGTGEAPKLPEGVTSAAMKSAMDAAIKKQHKARKPAK